MQSNISQLYPNYWRYLQKLKKNKILFLTKVSLSVLHSTAMLWRMLLGHIFKRQYTFYWPMQQVKVSLFNYVYVFQYI